jgi:hypothetical protein
MIARGVSPRDYQPFLRLNPNQDLPGALIAALEKPEHRDVHRGRRCRI